MVESDGKKTRIERLKLAHEHLEAGNLDAAWPIIDRELKADPNDPQTILLCCMLHEKTGRHSVAYQLASRAVQIAPHRPEVWNNLGVCADELWRIEEAERSYRKAAQLAPDDAQKAIYLVNVGALYINTGDFERAEKVLREALRYAPDSPKGRANLGFAELALRKWGTAWDNYHRGLGITVSRKRVVYGDEPEWDGTPGQTVAIYGEQGLGDEISFASVVPDAIRDCKRVILDSDSRLVGLFQRSFPEAKVYGTRFDKRVDWAKEDREIDASIAIGALGKFYRRSKDAFTGEAFLKPCPTRSAMWRSLLSGNGKPTIGLTWSGGIEKTGAKYRRIALAQLRPFFDAVDANWVCLQYKDAADEIREAAVPLVQYPFATLTKDYDDTAALVSACDLVVTMQTTVVHLAGGLGVPCWVMVSAVGQWRYGVYGEDLPWAKSVRMIRNRDRESWHGVIQKVTADLRAKKWGKDD